MIVQQRETKHILQLLSDALQYGRLSPMGLVHPDLTLSSDGLKELKGINRNVRKFLVQYLAKTSETDEKLKAKILEENDFIRYVVSLVSNGEEEEQLAASKALLSFLTDAPLRDQAVQHGAVKAQLSRFSRLNETNRQILDSMTRVGMALDSSQTIINKMEEKYAGLDQEGMVRHLRGNKRTLQPPPCFLVLFSKSDRNLKKRFKRKKTKETLIRFLTCNVSWPLRLRWMNVPKR